MISNKKEMERIHQQVFRSTEKVMPVKIEILKGLLRERGCQLATPEQISFCYVNDAAFRSMMYSQGWALTSQIGIERMEYIRLNPKGGQVYRISWDEFVMLSPPERSVLLPGKGVALASNTYFDGKACLVLRADITEQKPRDYLYTVGNAGKLRTIGSQIRCLSVS